MLLKSVFARTIRIGRLNVIDAAGNRHLFEGSPGPSATIRLHDITLHSKLLLRPSTAALVAIHMSALIPAPAEMQ